MPFILIVGVIKSIGGEDYLYHNRDGLFGFSASVSYGVFLTFSNSVSTELMALNYAGLFVGLIITCVKTIVVGLVGFFGAKFYSFIWDLMKDKIKNIYDKIEKWFKK